MNLTGARLQRISALCCCTLLACTVGAFGLPSSAHATTMTMVDIVVEADGHTGTWSWVDNVTGPTYSWSLPSTIEVVSSTNSSLVLATFDDITVDLDFDPFVALGFNVTAGGAPTNFTISSAVVAFAPINNGLAFASAAITATETPPFDGASVTGAFPGTKAYQAQYNGASSIFANLVSPVTVVPGGLSNTGTEKFPPGIGTRSVIPGLTSDIQSQFKFTLSANDQASGTSIFDIIVPEPSSVIMAVFGFAAFGWCAVRRRRK